MTVERTDLIGTELDYLNYNYQDVLVEKAFEITEHCGPGFDEGDNSRATLSYGHDGSSQIVRVMWESTGHKSIAHFKPEELLKVPNLSSTWLPAFSDIFKIDLDLLVEMILTHAREDID